MEKYRSHLEKNMETLEFVLNLPEFEYLSQSEKEQVLDRLNRLTQTVKERIEGE
jgi:hypothetical protein